MMLRFAHSKIEERYHPDGYKKSNNEKAYTLEEKREENGNAYLPWDDEADALLIRMYDEGRTIKILSEMFERTQGAIRSRLKKLGKID